jgi:hypothetical protein
MSPDDTLREFFLEKAAIFAETNSRLSVIYNKYLADPAFARRFLLRDPSKVVFEPVKENGPLALIVVQQIDQCKDVAPPKVLLRERYHLSSMDNCWQIIRLDRECFLCHGTGAFEGALCSECRGEGWR